MNFVKSFLANLYGKSREYYYQKRYQEYREQYDISNDFGFNGTDIRFYGNGNLIIGKNSYIGTNSTIQIAEKTLVQIGFNCQISHNVRIYTSSANPDQDFRIDKIKPEKKGDVIIGDGVWIGANVFINPNVSIGSNSVIGANSVVTKDIPENTIYGGVPAKLIKVKSL